ncbi:MAG: hypothetical protein INR81_14845 [Microcystis aeruginosa PMC 728.11]|nr:hypothetical protein [Microcystis aeruginosa PMC 728.11]
MQNELKSAIELIKDDPLRIGVMRIVGNISLVYNSSWSIILTLLIVNVINPSVVGFVSLALLFIMIYISEKTILSIKYRNFTTSIIKKYLDKFPDCEISECEPKQIFNLLQSPINNKDKKLSFLYVIGELSQGLKFSYINPLSNEETVRIFHTKSSGKTVPDCHICYQSDFNGSSFIFLKDSPEDLTVVGKYIVRHEIGHSCFEATTAMRKASEYDMMLFILIFLILPNNLLNLTFWIFLLIYFFSVGKVLNGKLNRTYLDDEIVADTFALLNSNEDEVKRLVKIVKMKANFLSDGRLKDEEYEERINNLLDRANMFLDGSLISFVNKIQLAGYYSIVDKNYLAWSVISSFSLLMMLLYSNNISILYLIGFFLVFFFIYGSVLRIAANNEKQIMDRIQMKSDLMPLSYVHYVDQRLD